MSPVFLYRKDGSRAHQLEDNPFSSEKELQTFFEANLPDFVGVHFLATEYSTGPPYDGRIDTLGLDIYGFPVVIEYKRRSNENIINQGLFYLDWLRNNEAEFRSLVHTRLGRKHAGNINFERAWLLCVAWEFTDRDVIAARDSKRRIELIGYQRFGEDLVAFEEVYIPEDDDEETSMPPPVLSQDVEFPPKSDSSVLADSSRPHTDSLPDFSKYENWDKASAETRQLFMELHAFVTSLGEDVSVDAVQSRISFKRRPDRRRKPKHGRVRVIASVLLLSRDQRMVAYANVDPSTVKLQRGYTRDRRGYSHPSWNDLEITIRSGADLERAKPLLLKAYENS